jgi:alkylated DNA repair dioxygenase AlkB
MMRFTNKRTKHTIEHLLKRCSILLLTGAARYDWTHAIPARKTDVINGTTTPRGRRLSITFRTVLAL